MTAKPSADAKPAEAGRYGARRMTTTRRASRSGTRRTAGCWYAATPAATRSASSRRFERAACGPRTTLRLRLKVP